MFKLLRRLLVLVIILGAILVGGFIFMDSLIVKGVEAGGSHALGVDCQCGGANLSVVSGDLSLSGLGVDNPQGFTGKSFLEVGRVAMEIPFSKLLGDDVIEVPRLEVDDLTISLEAKDGKRNYQAIIDSLEKLKGTDSSDEEGRRFIIRHVVMSDTEIKVDLLGLPAGLGALDLKIPKLELRDLGAEDGKGLLTGEVVGVLVQSLLEAVSRKLGAQPVLAPFTKDLGGRVAGLLKEGSAGGDAMKMLGDLLNKKK